MLLHIYIFSPYPWRTIKIMLLATPFFLNRILAGIWMRMVLEINWMYLKLPLHYLFITQWYWRSFLLNPMDTPK